MHLLENGVNLIYIRDLLGHASIVTTEVYAKANPEMKRQAIQSAAAKTLDQADTTRPAGRTYWRGSVKRSDSHDYAKRPDPGKPPTRPNNNNFT